MKKYEMILKKLNDAGYEGYLVGGCVRDMFLGKQPSDYDIATNATPEEMKKVFQKERVIETGIKHGTVSVLFEGETFEITVYRTEGNYSDGRHPDSVQFTRSLSEDLLRRDFTVNAMAMDLSGKIEDFYGGREDLKNKIIRAVGNPEKRFSEDALRILRALRFSSTLGFKIEKQTSDAIVLLKERLRGVSKERCFEELKKLLCGKNAESVLLHYWEVIAEVIPELAPMRSFHQNNPHHCYTLDKHTAVAVGLVPGTPALRLAALLHDVGKPQTEKVDEKGISHYYQHASIGGELALKILQNLKSDGQTLKTVCFLVRHHDAPAETTKEQTAKKLRKYGEENYRLLIALRRADNLAQAEAFHREKIHDQTETFLEELLAEEACVSLKKLAVNGRDLMSEGFKQGPEIGRMLEKLLDAVIEEKIENEKSALLAYAVKIKAESKGK